MSQKLFTSEENGRKDVTYINLSQWPLEKFHLIERTICCKCQLLIMANANIVLFANCA